ncbi:MAG: UDP-N-acetylmuramoyl-L-alanine--D-glutamate ligase, partial [Akkermansiaceae bacterium]|nr:UDP-N-acetylmuramoyl-L-alanine--D-glutamate ligase [Verrucomicrobiales bacterium]
LVLQVNAFQLETTQFFRPAVSVLLNATPDHLDRYASQEDYLRAFGKLFKNQQAFDWAIIQTEALAKLKALDLVPPSKTITFSAHDQSSDIYLDRGLIISRLGNWEGPLLDTEQCQLRGPHNAENLMAALAVGRALRLSLENMVGTLKVQPHGAHRFELVAEKNGIQFINDSKATNPEALHHALLATRSGEGGKANVWLIAGGHNQGVDFHSVSPLISRRVKGAFLIGETREKIRSAWSLFTPCTLSDSLLEAVTVAAKNAVPGDVILLSPACSSFDQFQNYQQRGERFCQIVKSISWGEPSATPNMNDKTKTT